MTIRRFAILAAVWALGIAGAAAYGQGDYSAQLADGTFLSHVDLSDWNDNAPPRFMSHPEHGQPRVIAGMLDPRNPARWVRAAAAELAPPPQSYVEMFGGDRVPGLVVGFEYPGASPMFSRPPHLLVKPDWPVGPGDEARPVRVDTRDIRRVVIRSRRTGGYTPGVLYLDGGRPIPFRQLRWTSDGVDLLLADGSTQRVAFDQLSEVDLPRRDPWDVYVGQLARTDPACDSPLLRMSTAAGLVATASMTRFHAEGDRQVIQPPWSVDPIWVPRRMIRQWTLFAPSQVPLSIIDPVGIVQRSALEGARRMRIDRSATGGELRSGGRVWGWGAGMQARTEAIYELPAMARAFESRVALDPSVQRGGCARAMVCVDSPEKPIWQSPPMMGAATLLDTGAVKLPAASPGGSRTLVLVADAMEHEHPAGADPLNIRDFVNWLEPVVDLDPAALAGRVKSEAVSGVAAWAGWTLEAGLDVVFKPRWDSRLHRFTDEARVTGGDLLLSRRVHVSEARPLLCLTLFHYGGTQAGTIKVRVDHEPVGQFEVPEQPGPWEPSPRVVSLRRFVGRDVTIEVEQVGPKDAGKGAVVWDALGFVADPTLASPLSVLSARAKSGNTQITVQGDGSILAVNRPGKSESEHDIYTVRCRTDLAGITGFRLELLTDDKLPGRGPGRHDGQTMLSTFSIEAAPLSDPQKLAPVPLISAAATDAIDTHDAVNVIDSNVNDYWQTSGGHSHAAVFTTDHPVGSPGGTLLLFTLDNRAHGWHMPGRFRISAIRGAMPSPVPSPAVMVTAP